MSRRFQPSDICWSIYDKHGDECYEVLVPDGLYTIVQTDFLSGRQYDFDEQISVCNGQIDVQAAREVIASFLNATKNWHCFIEVVYSCLEEPGTISFGLGS